MSPPYSCNPCIYHIFYITIRHSSALFQTIFDEITTLFQTIFDDNATLFLTIFN